MFSDLPPLSFIALDLGGVNANWVYLMVSSAGAARGNNLLR